MLTFDQIIKDIDQNNFKPLYYLMGEEGYYIDAITQRLEQRILPEEERSFNQHVLYGKDTDIATVLNTARQFPMMSNYNVVILKEAQDLKGIAGEAKGAVDPFMLYAEKPAEKTILIVNYRGKSLDKRKKLYKILDKQAVLFEAKKLYDNQVGPWISTYVKQKGYSIDAASAELMASHIGNDLVKVVNEMNKLTIVLPQGTAINSKIIEEHIGISKDFNVFELQKAIGRKDIYQVNLIVHHMGKNPKTSSIIPMVANLYGYFTKVFMVHYAENKSNDAVAAMIGVPPFFAKDYIQAARHYSKAKCASVIHTLREYDAKSKGIDSPPVDDGDLMREMMYKIIH